MKVESDTDCSLCEDGLHTKISGRRRQYAGRTSHMSTSVGGETTITACNNQIKTSNPDFCEENKLDGHKQGNIQVKEEHMSSEEEDTFSGDGEENVSSAGEQVSSSEKDTSSREGDLRSTEAGVLQDPPVTQLKWRRDKLKFNVGRSKEISEDLRKRVVEAHKNGKGYKRIAKDLDLHQSTVRKIVYKWKKFSTVATLPRSGRPPKIGAKARYTILKHMTENTRVTAKDLKASLALDNINVHESTIRKTLSKWCSWDFTMEEAPALQKE